MATSRRQATRITLAIALLGLTSTAVADDHGVDLNVHNKTGHEVLAFLFPDDQVHLDESHGTQFAHLKNGESGVVHVPACKFSILLVDHDDLWHAELHDCHTLDLTFTADDKRHAKKHH